MLEARGKRGFRRFTIPSLACRLQNAGVLLPTRLKLGRRVQKSWEQRAIRSLILRRVPLGTPVVRGKAKISRDTFMGLANVHLRQVGCNVYTRYTVAEIHPNTTK